MGPPDGNTLELSPSRPPNTVECTDSAEVKKLPSNPICHLRDLLKEKLKDFK